MSKYAQLITSFERTGNFPLEANYIFATVEDLKAFYADPIQAATLHKGLLKVVERNPDGLQALYWVTKKETKNELEFKELIAGKDITDIEAKLTDYLQKLNDEIKTRENADKALWGINNPSEIDEEYNSINDLGLHLKSLQKALEKLTEDAVSGDNSLKNQLKEVVGTTDNDVIEFMQNLPFSSIREIAKALDRVINGQKDEETGEVIETDAIDTFPELAAFLEGYTNKDTLKQILTKLWNTIEGEILPTTQFRTLRGIEDYIIEYRTANDYKQKTLLEEMNRLEIGIGLNPDGSYSPDVNTNYLQNATSVMNALQILDKTLHKYASANVPAVRNTDDAIQLSLSQELDSYVIAAALKLSTQAGNQLVKNSDGLYSSAKTYYENGVLTFRVNGNIVSQHYIGMNAIVQSAFYDNANEQLVFVFKLDSGDTQTINIPVGALIREWEPYNADTSPIVLERYDEIAGTDKLSADVRLSTSQFNILVKDGNTLYVKGSTDNLYHEGIILSKYLSSHDEASQQAIDSILEKLEEARIGRDELQHSLDTEKAARQADVQRIDGQLANDGAAILKNQQDIAQEAVNRKDADTTLERQIETESNRAATEEHRLQLEINSEADRAKQVESEQSTILQTITERVADEITRSIAVDQELSTRIDNIRHPEYKVEKQSTPEPGCIATYVVTKDGVQVGNKIDVPEVPVVVSTAYEKGVLTIIVNGVAIGIHDLGLAAIVHDSYFDNTSDELVTEYNLHNGDTQVVRTPLHAIVAKLEEKIAAVDEKVDNIHIPEYRVEKQSTPEAGCVATYIVTKDGIQVGNKIDIAEVPVKVNATYVDGILTLIVNDVTVGIFDLGLAAAVKDSYYDADNDEIVTEFNLHNGRTQVVRTQVHAIIEKLNEKIAQVNERIDNIHVPEYTITKQAVPDAGNFATYVLTKDNNTVGQKVNIPTQKGISAENGNQILEKLDGFYMKVGASYDNGVLSLLVNDSIVNTFNLGISSIVSDSYYDSTTEELVMVYNLHDGSTQTVRIAVHSLIQEWKVVNEDHTVILTKTQVVNGPDELSADVAISSAEQKNILQKDSTGLFVKGTADNITTENGKTVQTELDEHKAELDTKAPIDSPIFTGIPQVETSPDDTDFSQRIPSTAWVKARMEEVLKEAKEYADSLLAIEWIDVTDDPSQDTGTGWINVQ